MPLTPHDPLGLDAIDHARPWLAIAGRVERFPVRRIFCVGRNYADHAVEMGADPTREPPFFFMKPADAAFTAAEGIDGEAPGVVPYPPQTHELHHEVELVVALIRGGRDLSPAEAGELVGAATVGLDLTRRDLQDVAKEKRRPWDLAKGFDASAPLGELVPVSSVDRLGRGRITLAVGGEARQDGDLAQQIWSVAEVLANLSASVELRAGDLVMTGTPAGVGRLEPGDRVTAEIEGLARLDVTIGAAPAAG